MEVACLYLISCLSSTPRCSWGQLRNRTYLPPIQPASTPGHLQSPATTRGPPLGKEYLLPSVCYSRRGSASQARRKKSLWGGYHNHFPPLLLQPLPSIPKRLCEAVVKNVIHRAVLRQTGLHRLPREPGSHISSTKACLIPETESSSLLKGNW